MSHFVADCLDQEPERYELREAPRFSFALNRRLFLGTAAGVGLLIGTRPAVAQNSPKAGSIAARLQIAPDGVITARTSKVEVGQGSRAELTQAVAEELAVAPEKIRLVMADTAETPDDGGTAGSRTTPSTVPAMRQAAAAAREALLGLAARRWGVDKATLIAEDSFIREKSGSRRVSYGELAGESEAALRAAAPEGVRVVPASEWKVMGTSVARPNGRDVVTGRHRYPSDIRREGMLYGHVLRPPSYGATLESIDLAPAKAMQGAAVVRDGDFVGCAAPTLHEAKKAVAALAGTAKWTQPPHPSSAELFDYLDKHAAPETAGRREYSSRREGSSADALAKAEQVVEARYEVPYVQHAPMEPRAACAEWQGDSLTVWTGTQQPSRVQGDLAQAFHIPESKVQVIVPDTGGGFGGKHTGECAVEAARLAKAAGKPVSLRWTREEELAWAYFRPAGLIRAKGGLDAEGKITAWEFENILSGTSALETPYDVPNKTETFRASDSPLRVGSYRALASTANNFARESMMDELAAKAGQDPMAFRLAHLTHPRLRPVLEAAAERFGWEKRVRNRKPGQGFGIACGTEKGSYVAACVEVSVDRERGSYEIQNVCQAFECGAVVNPDNLRAQNEGCIVMTLGAVLREEIRFENGKLLNGRFSQYRVPRFADVPPMDIVLMDRKDLPSVGAGETPMIAVPPAVANALFHATGVRLRSLPLRAAELRNTL
jgi:isoquinoline 1-oxidoreductase